MQELQIRKATPNDLERLLEIYEYARGFMRSTSNPHQWAKGGPTKEVLTEDIALGRLYVMGNATGIHASFMFSLENDPTYDYIEDGKWISDLPYGVIHRIAGDGEFHGILQTAVNYAKQFTNHLRIDTHHDNIVMQGAIGKCGFQRCGIIYIKDGSQRIAYELI